MAYLTSDIYRIYLSTQTNELKDSMSNWLLHF